MVDFLAKAVKRAFLTIYRNNPDPTAVRHLIGHLTLIMWCWWQWSAGLGRREQLCSTGAQAARRRWALQNRIAWNLDERRPAVFCTCELDAVCGVPKGLWKPQESFHGLINVC